MAKTETTVKGYVYTVTSPNGGTVSDATGVLNKFVDAGDQVTVTAPSDALTCSDDDAVITKANFKPAALALRLLGGGDNLPAGYTRVEFLQSTGTQYIDTGLNLSNEHVVNAELQMVAAGVVSGACFGSQDEGNRTNYAFSLYEGPSNNYAWLFYGSTSVEVLSSEVPDIDRYSRMRVRLKDRWLSINGKDIKRGSSAAFNAVRTCWIFDRNSDKNPAAFIGRFFSFVVDKGSTLMRLIPALPPAGEPCMFDTVTREPFRNAGSGSFIAGVGTVAQLNALLRNLPATGGELTLSLPAEANTPEVADMLQACHDTKGWTLTVHEYRPAAAATYSLRRVREVVWCRREQSELGSYVDATGTRWQIDRCAAIFGRLGNDPTAYGYTPFNSVDEAAAHWELTPYVDPTAMDEAMGDNGTLEQGDTENTSPATNS